MKTATLATLMLRAYTGETLRLFLVFTFTVFTKHVCSKDTIVAMKVPWGKNDNTLSLSNPINIQSSHSIQEWTFLTSHIKILSKAVQIGLLVMDQGHCLDNTMGSQTLSVLTMLEAQFLITGTHPFIIICPSFIWLLILPFLEFWAIWSRRRGRSSPNYWMMWHPHLYWGDYKNMSSSILYFCFVVQRNVSVRFIETFQIGHHDQLGLLASIIISYLSLHECTSFMSLTSFCGLFCLENDFLIVILLLWHLKKYKWLLFHFQV